MWGGQLNPVSTREDWIDHFTFKDNDTGELIPLTDVELTFAVSPKGSRAYPCLLATIANGKLVVNGDPTIATLTFTVDEVRQLRPGEYDVGLTMLRDGVTTQIFRGRLPVTDGIVP